MRKSPPFCEWMDIKALSGGIVLLLEICFMAVSQNLLPSQIMLISYKGSIRHVA